ncbi:MAG: UbiA family prenyltransferase [Candidatus Binatia bacterium]|nr:UbiA family prenyltransferase [Candidatus Binatia bacterium]
MPVDVRTLLAICRVSNLPTVWMNVLAAALLAQASPPASAVLFLMAVLSCSYCGGMVLNDYFDREHDARDQPFRPIPSGRIRKGQARRLGTGLLAMGLGLMVFAPNPTAMVPATALLAAIYVYDRWHKDLSASVFLMAATRTLVFVITGWALTGGVSGLVLFAGAVSFVWTLSVTVVARQENARGERFGFPVIPWMIAGMALVDGILLAIFVGPGWLAVGVATMFLTRFGQQYVRGD